MPSKFPVIDIFAGPGGLGEGFSQAGFDVALSCEMDPIACQTLTLRKFFHLFNEKNMPEEYYQFISKKITLAELQQKFPKQWEIAKQKVLNIELGAIDTAGIVNARIAKALIGADDFILVGGPPCQAYSIAGRSRRLGVGSKLIDESSLNNKNSDKSKLSSTLAKEFYNDPRHKLYLEYLNILAVHQPAIFVMENVKGLSSAKTGSVDKPGSVFSNIVSGLKEPLKTVGKTIKNDDSIYNKDVKYKLYSLTNNKFEKSLFDLDGQISSPKDCVIRAEEFNVPQSRHRIIIVGVREDITKKLTSLKPSLGRSTVADTISHMPRLRSGLSKQKDSTAEWIRAISEKVEKHLLGQTTPMLKLNEYLKAINTMNAEINRGADVVQCDQKAIGTELNNYLADERMNFVIQHETRGHITSDLMRYFFCSAYGKFHGRSPRINDWEGDLEYLRPNHKNVRVDKSKLNTSSHNDRFKVQVWNKPSSTIVSHISKDGHYFIHPDPTQCRSLTVREAARLQTFPDNYYFFGNRTQQYHQVGNAVPSFLSKQIANQLKLFLKKTPVKTKEKY